MGKCIARGSKKALVNECFKDSQTSGYIFDKIGRLLRDDVRKMCSDYVHSILSDRNSDSLKNFQWSSVMKEMQKHAPYLVNILLSCTKTKVPRNNRVSTICLCAAILFKFRYLRMNVVQKIITLILYTGHCEKQVYYMFVLRDN